MGGRSAPREYTVSTTATTGRPVPETATPPAGAPSVGELVLDVLRLLGPIKRELGRHLSLDRADLGPAAFGALRAVEGCGAARVSDVAAALHVDISVASRQVRALEEIGLVSRCVSEHDRRAHTLALTAAGHEALAATEELVTSALDDLVADWDDQAATDLHRLLARLHADLARSVPDHDHPTSTRGEHR